MTTLLRITDGTMVANLIWHNRNNRAYQLARDGWAPRVSRLRSTQLGGRSPYEDVTEEIALHVYGETQAEALANLATLSQLLDQAERWSRGELVDAVRIQYTPKGGREILEAVILGRAPGDETTGLGLATSFNRALNADMIEGIRMRFIRRGQWIGADTLSTTSAAVTNPGIMTVTLPDHAISSPASLVLTETTTGGVNDIANAFLLLTDAANKLRLIEAESVTNVRFTAVTDTVKKASDDRVLRYTPTDTNVWTLGPYMLSPALNAQCVAVFAVVRNNSASATFRLYVRLAGSSAIVATPEIVIDASTTNPRAVFLGTVVLPNGVAFLDLNVAASTTSGPPTLDIDYFVLLAVDDEFSRALAIKSLGSGFSTPEIAIAARVKTHLTPFVGRTDTSGSGLRAFASYAGDPLVTTRGTTMGALVMAPFATFWRFVTVSNVAVQHTLTVTRHTAYLTPQ